MQNIIKGRGLIAGLFGKMQPDKNCIRLEGFWVWSSLTEYIKSSIETTSKPQEQIEHNPLDMVDK